MKKILLALFMLTLAMPANAIDVIIKDSDGKSATVTGGNRLAVEAISQTRLQEISAETGFAHTYTSTFATGGTDIEVMSIENTASDKHMHLDQLWIGCDDVCTFVVGWMSTGTPAGTVITGRAMNEALGKTAPTAAFGNASVTGSITLDSHALFVLPADTMLLVDLEGAWVGEQGDTFVVQSGTSTVVYVTVTAHFDDID